MTYRLIPLGRVPLTDLISLWLVSDAERSIGFVVSTYRNQTTQEGRHSTPLKWGCITYKDGSLSNVECIFDSREEAGEHLKALLDNVQEKPYTDK